MLVFHDNKEDYSPEELLALKQAYDALTVKCQGGELTLEETKIRIAFLRVQRENDFKIVVTKVKVPKAPKEPKQPKEKKTRTKVEREVSPKSKAKAMLARASNLHFLKSNGVVLSDEDEAFLASTLESPPEL
jgi:hypothetical protein